MAITLAQAQARLDDWIEADAAVARGQAYSIGSRSLTRVDAKEIRESINYWERKVNSLSSGNTGGMRVRYGVPE